MKRFLPTSFLLISLLCFDHLAAQESSVYLFGGAGSYSALLPPEGFALRSLTGWYSSHKYADQNGDKSSLTDNVYGFYQQFSVQYVTDINMLGAKYVVGGMLPFATAETNPSNSYQINSRLFMADPYISPIGFSWQHPDYQVFADYRLYLPWGQYDPESNNNVGKGQYSHIISVGTTVFLDQFKYWSFTAIPRYEFHGERQESNIKGGSYFNFEWAITYAEHNTMDFGLIGYSSFQLTKDTGPGVPPEIQDIKDRVVAAGVEWGVLSRKIKTRFALRANFELYGIDRPLGIMVSLDIFYVPKRILFDE